MPGSHAGEVPSGTSVTGTSVGNAVQFYSSPTDSSAQRGVPASTERQALRTLEDRSADSLTAGSGDNSQQGNTLRNRRGEEQIDGREQRADAASLVQSERSIDGSGNNVENTDWGAAGATQIRLGDADYVDGIGEIDDSLPNPRAISNALFEQTESIEDPNGYSDYLWAWGQLIDHDITLTPTNSADPANISVPTGDPDFDPFFTGAVVLPFSRSEVADGTGETTAREQINDITAFIDASFVYGSEDSVFEALMDDTGRVILDDDEFLPLDDTGQVFAGDERAGENVGLTSLQTLLAREHNRWVDRLEERNPELTGDELYAAARVRVEAEVQAITYNDFLPKLVGADAIAAYSGYDSSIDPDISTEFATAAYRFGHSMLSSSLQRLNEDGSEIDAGAISLSDAFFNPSAITENGGIDPILRGLAAQTAQAVDTQVVEDVRSFLFGPPGAGGLDLVSLNIQRGRDHGLPDYNSLREAVGLDRVTSFDEITSDADVAATLESVYGSVDTIDAWVGGLAEDAVNGGVLGELFATIVIDQFTRLRDGDRLWSEAVLGENQADRLWDTTLADLIERNTDIGTIQQDVFIAYDRIGGTDADDTLAGDGDRDLLIGEAGADLLSGGAGDDELHGGEGSDTLIGGGGDDYLVGGRGGDTFVFADGFGDDTIAGFRQNDAIDLTSVSSVASRSDLSFSREDGTLTIEVGDEGSLTVTNYDGGRLDGDQLIFA